MATVTSSNLKSRQASYRIRNQTTGRFEFYVDTDSDALVDEVMSGSLTGTPDPVPGLYTYFGTANYVTAIDVAQRQADNFKKWLVTVTVGPLAPGTQPHTGPDPWNEDPLTRPADRWIELEAEKFVPAFDATDPDPKPILNSAGDPFPNPPTVDRWITVYVIKKNYATFQEIDVLNQTYNNTKNSVAITSLGGTVGTPAPGDLLVGTLKYGGTETGPPAFENGVKFWSGQTRVLYNPLGWDVIVPNEGYRFLNQINGQKENALDYTGQQTLGVVRLDDDGNINDAVLVRSEEEFNFLYPADFAPLFQDP